MLIADHNNTMTKIPQDGLKHTTWRIPIQAHKDLRKMAIDRGVTCQDLVSKIIMDFIFSEQICGKVAEEK